ncbi:MAG TPA: FliM/FliN family flagellar motor switch protein [Sphingobium sp.]|uniref:flagellar motor switch protein FliM n=1 Tax=Sphingobium sp. TaxID=1912891 RepID=UPI002ED5AC61
MMNDVKPYTFGKAAAQSPALLNAIDRLGDRLARQLRILLEPLCGTRPLVTAKPVDRTMFMMWDACVPSFTSLSLYRLHPIKGVVALRMDAPLVSCLVDRFYGGRGNAPDTDAREFRPTETRLIDRLSGQIMTALTKCWADVVPMEAMLIGRETGVVQAEIAEADADVVVQSFDVNLGERDSWTIEFIYPLDGLSNVEGVNLPRTVEDRRPADPRWQNDLAECMDNVRLPARTVLARPDLKMTELMALKPGDVINIHIARHLPLLIGDRVFAHGTIGEQDGRAAFMVEKLA